MKCSTIPLIRNKCNKNTYFKRETGKTIFAILERVRETKTSKTNYKPVSFMLSYVQQELTESLYVVYTSFIMELSRKQNPSSFLFTLVSFLKSKLVVFILELNKAPNSCSSYAIALDISFITFFLQENFAPGHSTLCLFINPDVPTHGSVRASTALESPHFKSWLASVRTRRNLLSWDRLKAAKCPYGWVINIEWDH